MKRGSIKYNNMKSSPAEEFAIEFLLNEGYDIEVIVPTNTPKNKNPDFLINGVPWELKSPITAKKRTISRLICETNKQCNKMVIDLRKTKLNMDIAVNILEYEFRKSHRKSHRARELIIITSSSCLHYKK